MLETEIKYKVSKETFDKVKFFYSAKGCGHNVFEVNYVFRGGNLKKDELLRVRELTTEDSKTYVLTYKNTPSIETDGYKTRKETELAVSGNPIELFLDLGYTISLVYEKERETFEIDVYNKVFQESTSACISFDVLPFGYYIEVEGTRIPELHMLTVEEASYPCLTIEHGALVEKVFEARFDKQVN